MNSTQPTAEMRLALLETAFAEEKERSRAHLAAAERRLRATWGLASLGVLATLLLSGSRESLAQGYGVTLAQLLNRVISLETKTASMSTLTDPNTGQPTVRFEGVNLQVVSGSGATDGPVNGVGNLIVGYNELREIFTDNRSGSHNLIVGTQQTYSSFGGFTAGSNNNIVAPFASVSGGLANSAVGNFSSISGGQSNLTFGESSSVTGGIGNTASAQDATVSGGENRTANGVSDWSAGALFQDK